MQPAGERGHWPTTAILVGTALLFYTLLRRDTAHGSDVFVLMRWLEDGVVHPNHPLYLIGARLVQWLLSPLTGELMAVLAAYSAFGAAVAVGALHRAALRLRGPRFSFWLAAVVMCTPCLMFFATIGEMHAPFAAVMAVCWWAFAVWSANGRRAAALGCGVLTGVAALQHATGQLLVPMLAAGFLWLRRHEPWSRRAGRVGLFAAAHAAVFALGFAALRRLGELPEGDPGGFLLERARSGPWVANLPGALLSEWLVAFLPLSVLALVPLFRGRVAVGLLLHAAVLAYVTVTAMLAPGVDEVGAYCLPLLFPAAVVALDHVPARAMGLVVALAAAATAAHRALHDEIAPDFALGAAVTASPGSPARVWLVGDEAESMGARWQNPDVELVEAWITAVDLERRAGPQAAAGVGEVELLLWLRLTAQRVLDAGRQLVVTRRAVEVLGERLPAFAPAWRQFASEHRVEELTGPDGWRAHLVTR